MMVMHIAYGLDLLAATAGTALLVWSIKNPGKGSWLGRLVGFLVMALAIISIFCIFSCSMRGGECHRPGEEDASMTYPTATDHGAAPKKMEKARR